MAPKTQGLSGNTVCGLPLLEGARTWCTYVAHRVGWGPQPPALASSRLFVVGGSRPQERVSTSAVGWCCRALFQERLPGLPDVALWLQVSQFRGRPETPLSPQDPYHPGLKPLLS